MDEHKYKKIKKYSQGMKQKLGILTATLTNFKVILLDEPHNSLDPASMIELRNYILALKEQGSTIILSSHSLSEISLICDSVIILDNGEVKTILSDSKIDMIESYLV